MFFGCGVWYIDHHMDKQPALTVKLALLIHPSSDLAVRLVRKLLDELYDLS
jgi:hypothetical protein